MVFACVVDRHAQQVSHRLNFGHIVLVDRLQVFLVDELHDRNRLLVVVVLECFWTPMQFILVAKDGNYHDAIDFLNCCRQVVNVGLEAGHLLHLTAINYLSTTIGLTG